MGPGLAPEATGVVLGLAALALALLVAALWSGRWPVWLVGLALGAAAILAATLYRDPPRRAPLGADLVVAPADGRVLAIDSVDEPYLGGAARRILIRSGLLDLRILRAPVDGVVDYTEADERTRLGISTGLTRILVDLGGGLPAVRVQEGDLVAPSDRMGVRRGSDLAVFLPGGFQVEVHPGTRVRSGESVLARAGERSR